MSFKSIHVCSFSFQSAWHNSPELQCFGTGENIVPTIHVKDLAAYVLVQWSISNKVTLYLPKNFGRLREVAFSEREKYMH